MTNLHDALIDIIDAKADEVQKKDVWHKAGLFNRLKAISVDSRGKVGEKFIAQCLVALGHKAEINRATDRTSKHWDVLVNNKIKLEIKTATVGKTGRNFQHDNIEKDRDYHALVLLDIAPSAIYVTAAPKDTLPFNKPNALWTVHDKCMHRRAQSIAYKWTLNIKDVENRKAETLDDFCQLIRPVL